MNSSDLWFSTPDTQTLCRAGGNGPNHPSQLYAIRKYVIPLTEKGYVTFLDYGCGSATTYEAIKKEYGKNDHILYVGMDIIPKNLEWCRNQYPAVHWRETEIHKISANDKAFDVVYSRHVVDHMRSFEEALDEHCRVAKKLVIIVLWVPFATTDEHQIKNIVDQGKVYKDEYTNSYSAKKVMEALAEKQKQGWRILEIATDVGSEVKGHDTVIVLQRG